MISASGRSAARAAGRHLRIRRKILAAAPSTSTAPHRRWKSSASAFADYVPDAVREAVKSTVLEEAARPDSAMWADDRDAASSSVNGTRYRQMNGPAAAQQRASAGAEDAASTGGSIDEAISEARLSMLNDPLDEWHLSRSPLHFTSCGKPSPPAGVRPVDDGADPFALSRNDMDTLSEGIRRDLIGSEHPVLTRAASYFFQDGAAGGGKKVRPMMVLLLSRAMALSGGAAPNGGAAMPAPLAWQRPDLPASQRRLAEISEMIHTASLFHDDVIDGADTRRGAPAVHRAFGNKTAILAGDYLLARASVCLARLRDVEVVETMSTIIEHLVRGEVMQMKGSGDGSNTSDERLAYYLRKNFYKTASLMANSCKSAAILGGYSDEVVSAAYRYGKHLGVSFQLVDDVLDFDGSASTMGKAALSDLNSGLATAPVLFAAETYPDELDPLIERKFREEGDVLTAVEVLRKSDGIERTKELARVHADLAIDALMELGREGDDSKGSNAYRDSLVHLAYKVVDRVR
uniref:Uncharacterized protein n=1 Tax=Odontella aurita TaxID=265563 RepID=A0A7S4N1Y9_9STRA|mmetsp:Transcript_44126/g.134378  ORF Transcript_44126/g.134378 Transcript_44126/m.134378 type:complete len:519 (+) Transcript_44126:312-1868(+)